MRLVTLVPTALLLSFVALALAEQERPWQLIQAEFQERELSRLRSAFDAEKRRSAESRLDAREELASARGRIETRQEDLAQLENELRRAQHGARWAAMKLDRFQARVSLEPSSVNGEDLRQARRELEEFRSSILDLEERREVLASELETAERGWSLVNEPLVDLERQIRVLEKGKLWRNLPFFRGISGAFSIREITPARLEPEVAGVLDQPVDRCMTCHLRADESREEASSSPPPLRGHPGTLVGEESFHPVSSFGCTVCHGGNGRATDFSRAGHHPRNADQEAEWKRKWSFDRRHLPRRRMLPTRLIEAGCARCHEGEIRPRSPEPISLELGRKLTFFLGCGTCHADRDAELRNFRGGANSHSAKRGPTLRDLAFKTTPEWAFHWIKSPRRFRPTTWMPHLLPDDMTDQESTAVVRAMVRYLWSRSENLTSDEESEIPEGDPSKGAELFATVGCTGCHLLDREARRDLSSLERLHGPNLALTGNKLQKRWLYPWLLDPRSQRLETTMPNLRLSEKEAADLTAFLMADRTADWDHLSIPPVDPAVRDQLVLRHLEEEGTIAASAERLRHMSEEEKDLYLGYRSLELYGCQSCHEIAGLKNPRAVAPPLGDVGALALDRVSITHPREAPSYALSGVETDAVRLYLLSRRSAAKPYRPRAEREPSQDLAVGRRLLERFGCLGCHRFEERGGAVAATLAPGEPQPPSLTSAGARLQAPWLVDYLREPGRYVRRPWLDLRMPTFDFSETEMDILVRFFLGRAGKTAFEPPLPQPSKRSVKVGEAVATMLQCDRCHHDSPGALSLPRAELAPAYREIRSQLRPDWVVAWLLDPEGLDPHTRMPTIFGKNENGAPDATYLEATISAPMFSLQRQRLLTFFETEEELLAYLANARRVSVGLRDYFWSLK